MTHRTSLLSAAITVSLAVASVPAVAAELFTVERPIEGRYIVVLKEQSASLSHEASGKASVASVAQGLSAQYGATLTHSFEHSLRGFAVEADDTALAKLLADPRVEYVEEDGEVTISETQNDATWGLDRIDQRNLPLDSNYTYDTTASGVNAYILDTGVLTDHTEFSGRLGEGFRAVEDDGRGTSDCHGHGTHVAGTVGGTTWGVAKQAKIHPVRVFSCSGSSANSIIIAGIDWVTGNHAKPAVANLSLGGPASEATDSALNNMINSGVVAVVAAGNSNTDACNSSPARVPNALTVGSTDRNDARSIWSMGQGSSWGSCLDLFAPGSDIVSAGIDSNSGQATMSGTSMASPHVAGVAALYLANNPSATPAQVNQAVVDNATPDVVSDERGSPNRLLYSLFGGDSPPPPDNTPPVPDFTSSANGLTVQFTDTSTDSDGSIASRSWDFGDGTTSTDANPSKTYAAAGAYNVTLTVTDDDGATATKSAEVTVSEDGGGGVQTYRNNTDVEIRDYATVESTIEVSGRSGNGSSSTPVAVRIQHTYIGDLKVDLVAPDGTEYVLHNRSGGSRDNINRTYRLNLSDKPLNGTWRLRVNDNQFSDTGKIDSWAIRF